MNTIYAVQCDNCNNTAETLVVVDYYDEDEFAQLSEDYEGDVDKADEHAFDWSGIYREAAFTNYGLEARGYVCPEDCDRDEAIQVLREHSNGVVLCNDCC